MRRHSPLFATVLVLAASGPSFAQDISSPRGFVGSSQPGLNTCMPPPPLPVPPPRTKYTTWQAGQQLKTGRITIEFQYAAPADMPASFWRFLLPTEAFAWVSADWSPEQAAHNAASWRRDLPTTNEMLPETMPYTLNLGLVGFPALSDADILECGTDATVIRSIEVTPLPDAPVPTQTPSGIRLEFNSPRPPPRTNPKPNQGPGLDPGIVFIF
jgi:hypothetical protein